MLQKDSQLLKILLKALLSGERGENVLKICGVQTGLGMYLAYNLRTLYTIENPFFYNHLVNASHIMYFMYDHQFLAQTVT